VPEHVSIVGFDNIEFAAHVTPPLTTVEQAFMQIGRESARILLPMIEGGTQPETRKRVIPTKLLVRESTRQLPRQPG